MPRDEVASPAVPRWSRRAFLSGLAALALARTVRAADGRWKAYGRAPVIDGLGGPGTYGREGRALTAAELADVRASGLSAVNVTVGPVGRYAGAFEDALKSMSEWDAEIEAHPDLLLRVATADDLERARRDGKLGLIYGFQDTAAFGEDLDRIALFRRAGLRIAQLTCNNRNLVGDGCLEPGGAGLSKFGRRVLERLHAEKLLVDLSHGGRQVTLDAIAASG
jgi:membrane dipeptidase